MREWQVGDPVGDGNDIGVPDTRYMGYLKDDENEDEKVEDFRFYFTQFHEDFMTQKYDTAFNFLKRASESYQDLNSYQRSQLSDNPFSHPFVAELCSKIYNMRDERQSAVIDIINRHNVPIVICDNCKNIYPNHIERCDNCGKSFEKSPYDEAADKLAKILQRIIYDKSAIAPLVTRSMILMRSNYSVLTSIEETDLFNVDFIFEKEHEYFKTTYAGQFNQEYHEMRIFEEFDITHDHTKLLNNKKFQDSIRETEKRTGFRFMECDGGYGAELDKNRYDFIFTDEIYVFARFDMGNGHTAVFDVDLDNLKLSKNYEKY